jgi:hypothetical protein
MLMISDARLFKELKIFVIKALLTPNDALDPFYF